VNFPKNNFSIVHRNYAYKFVAREVTLLDLWEKQDSLQDESSSGKKVHPRRKRGQAGMILPTRVARPVPFHVISATQEKPQARMPDMLLAQYFRGPTVAGFTRYGNSIYPLAQHSFPHAQAGSRHFPGVVDVSAFHFIRRKYYLPTFFIAIAVLFRIFPPKLQPVEEPSTRVNE